MRTPRLPALAGPLPTAFPCDFQDAQVPARARPQLLHLAWAIMGQTFGSRQWLYEPYASGTQVRLTVHRYLPHAKALVLERWRDVLQQAG